VALSATHYPARGLTFGILYGSTFTTEKNILQRLQTITFEAAHPLLLPGIVAELELVRHTRLVEVSINEVETKIFELNFQSGSARGYRRAEVERRNVAKRTAWLDLTYLRNSITTWSTQLLKMAEHAAELNRDFYKISQDAASFAPDLEDLRPEHERSGMQLDHSTAPFKSKRPSRLPERMASVRRSDSQHSSPTRTRVAIHQSQDVKISRSDEDYIDACPHYEDPKWQFKQMHEVGEKIQHRLAAIRDEYDEKIRDCTMRVDGMAMATQWVSSFFFERIMHD
jgi:chromosome segregation ATPase